MRSLFLVSISRSCVSREASKRRELENSAGGRRAGSFKLHAEIKTRHI